MSEASAVLLDAERAAIEKLFVGYAQYVDDVKPQDFADLFASDGILEVGGQQITGRAALIEFAERSSRGVHVQSGARFSRPSEGVIDSVCSFIFAKPDGTTVAGYYYDRIVSVGERIVFGRRRIDIRVAP
jgi:hypothetical protein